MSALAFERKAALDGFAVATMVALTFSWGLNGVLAKIANTGFDPVATSLLRCALGSLLVFGWCLWRRVPIFQSDGTLWAGLLAGLLFGIEFALIYISLDYTSVPRNALMLNTMPFWTLLGAHFLLGERMTPRKLGGLALAFCGVALVFSDRLSALGPQTWIGDLMSLGAGLAWAATILVIKRSRLDTALPEKVLLYQIVVASLLMCALLPFTGPFIRDLSTMAIGSILIQAVAIVAISYQVWFWIMRQYPASSLSSFAFLTPAFGVICGGILLDEPLSARIFIALGLIAVGLVIVNRPARRSPPAA